MYGADFHLTLRQEGTNLWGAFDLSVIEVVIHFSTRTLPTN